MVLKFSLWTFLTTASCLVAPSVGEVNKPHSITPDTIPDEKNSRYATLPRILSLAVKANEIARNENGFRPPFDHETLMKLLKILERADNMDHELEHQQKKKRRFPEIGARGFEEDIFDEGFGDWSPMKRW